MRLASLKFRKARLAAGLLLVVGSATPAAAQSVGDVLQSSYALWGMMDAVANHCWEVADWDPAYMEAHQNWLSRNLIIRDELDGALASSGAAASLPSEGERLGSEGILEIFRAAENGPEACGNWLASTNTGGYDAEVFLATQLGLLRERDGL